MRTTCGCSLTEMMSPWKCSKENTFSSKGRDIQLTSMGKIRLGNISLKASRENFRVGPKCEHNMCALLYTDLTTCQIPEGFSVSEWIRIETDQLRKIIIIVKAKIVLQPWRWREYVWFIFICRDTIKLKQTYKMLYYILYDRISIKWDFFSEESDTRR